MQRANGQEIWAMIIKQIYIKINHHMAKYALLYFILGIILGILISITLTKYSGITIGDSKWHYNYTSKSLIINLN